MSDDDVVAWRSSFGVTVSVPPDYGIIHTYTPPSIGLATIEATPAGHTITAGRLWDGDLLATYRRARAQVVVTIAAGLRDAGLTDEATIDRLTEAVVKRLGEGV